MKFQTTKKYIKETNGTIICIPYADLQSLLMYEEPIAYTAGVYRWNANIYNVGRGVVIVTGYRPFGNVNPSYELYRPYEEKAKSIIHDWNIHQDAAKLKIRELLNQFVNDAINQ